MGPGPGLRVSARTAAVVLAIVSSGAAAGGPVPAPLAIRAEPGRLLLGTDRAALLVVEGATEPPSFTTSAGEVRDIRAVSAGRFEAQFLPPREGWPQVAIVTARAGDRFAWTSVLLHGRGTAIAHTKPWASIRVTIAGDEFGPARADQHGEAHVPVIVPPGVRFAYHGEKPLDLRVPPALHVDLVPERTSIRADREEVVPLRILAVSPDGAPRTRAPVELSATAGEVDRPEELAPGEYLSRCRLAPGPAGEVRITARLSDEGPSRTVTLRRAAGHVARVQVEPDPPVAVAGRERPIALRIRVSDTVGNPLDMVPTVVTSFGSVSPVAARGPGLYEAALVVPQQRGQVVAANVTARVGEVSGVASIALAAGPAERLVVEGAGDRLVADGTREAVFRVALLDRFGNEAAAEPTVALASGSGAVRSEPDAAGGRVVRYRPRRAREDQVHLLAFRPQDRRAAAAPVAPCAAPRGSRSRIRCPRPRAPSGHSRARLIGRWCARSLPT